MTKFRRGFWTHDRFSDVFIEIVKVQFVKPNEYTKMKVNWWNRGQMGKPWIISYRPEKIKIKAKDYKYWSRYEVTVQIIP